MENNVYKTTEEITKKFIEDGWSPNTFFTELTLEEAVEKGYLFAIDKISKGHKYFKMNITENIFDEKGEIVMFNLKVLTK